MSPVDPSRLIATAPKDELSADELRGYRVVIAYSPSAEMIGLPRVLSKAPLLVGREAEGLSLPDSTASRVHASFEVTSEGPVVRDLGSRNGIYVRGVRVEKAVLANQDTVRIGDHLLLLQALEEDDIQRLVEPPPRASDARMIGDGVAMRSLRHAISKAKDGAAPVLILGESGSGKELAAAEIHAASGRTGAFIPVNCAALPEHLVESELFGHARGAFSGAAQATDGLFGAAAQGTIFLDEVGETSSTTQARLLRVLADGEVRRVGETQARRLDVRVLAATNRSLPLEIDRGAFRGDLYARLRAHVVEVPSLAERRDDLLLLALALLEGNERRDAAAIPRTFTPDAAEALLIHPFRWNVRELAQQMATLKSAPRPISAALLSPEIQGPLALRKGPAPAPSREPPRILEVRPDATPTDAELRTVIQHFGGNVSRIAAFFGKERRQIYRWAERYAIDLEEERG